MSLSEFEIIQRVFRQQKVDRNDVQTGIGDDAAVLTVPDNHQLTVSMDTLIEGVHFPTSMSPEDIGYRSLAVNLSDLAAMGATPAWMTLAITLPDADHSWLSRFSSGLFDLADEFDVQLIGGDITRGSLSITIQAHGFVEKETALLRSRAKVGDSIFVSGFLGDAAGGLLNWGSASDHYLLSRFARPVPRVREGMRLRNLSQCAIDISDGLIADLSHVLEASGVGAEIEVDKLPLSTELIEEVGEEKARQLALSGGDDYELCFTVADQKIPKVREIFTESNATLIGKISHERGVQCFGENGELYPVDRLGYQHF